MKDRISILHNLDIEDFSNPRISQGANATNLLYSKYGDGDIYAESRPQLQIYQEVEEDNANYARGVYYWESSDTLIHANKSTVYYGLPGLPIPGTLASTKERLYFHEFSEQHLAIVDVEANDLYLITNTGGVLTGTSIKNSLPTGLVDNGISGGGVTLDGYLFLLDKKGYIYNSDNDDITTWNDLWVIKAGRSVDFGTYLTQQGDHLVYVGTSSIEFFYNAGNPTGSVLRRRPDISFNIGCGNHHQVYNNGTDIFFVGASLRGSFGLYKINNFKITYKSNDSVDKYIAEQYYSNPSKIYTVSCARVLEHVLVYITCVDVIEGKPFSPKWTIVYDDPIGIFYIYTTGLYTNPVTKEVASSFPILDIAEKVTNSISGQTYQLMNGNLAIFRYTRTKTDSSGISYYVNEDGTENGLREYIEDQDNYVAPIGRTVQYPLYINLTTDEYDAGTYNYKIMNQFTVNGRARPPFDISPNEAQQAANIRWTDDAYRSFSEYRTLDMKIPDRKLTRLGSFRRRAFQFTYEGTERLRLTSFEVDISTAEYK